MGVFAGGQYMGEVEKKKGNCGGEGVEVLRGDGVEFDLVKKGWGRDRGGAIGSMFVPLGEGVGWSRWGKKKNVLLNVLNFFVPR